MEVEETCSGHKGNKGRMAPSDRPFHRQMKIVSMVARNGEKRSIHVASVADKTLRLIRKGMIAENTD